MCGVLRVSDLILEFNYLVIIKYDFYINIINGKEKKVIELFIKGDNFYFFLNLLDYFYYLK